MTAESVGGRPGEAEATAAAAKAIAAAYPHIAQALGAKIAAEIMAQRTAYLPDGTYLDAVEIVRTAAGLNTGDRNG